jgi:hypothetical protein
VSAATSREGTAASVEQSVFAAAPLAECDFSRSALVALPGPRGATGGAGGLQRRGASPGSPTRAARGHSTPATAFRTPPADTDSNRAAVTRATSSRGLVAERGERVDGEGGAQSPPVCGPGAGPLADIPAALAVSASNLASASGTTATAPSHPAPATGVAGQATTSTARPLMGAAT